MAENGIIASKVHWSFWLVAIVAFVWNGMGAMNYIWQTTPEVVASMPESHRLLIENRPVWATSGFAIGVFGGLLGAILLMLRKSASYYVFLMSLLGVIVQLIHTLGAWQRGVALSTTDWIAICAMPFLVAIFLVWYSKRTNRLGWTS